MKYVYQLNHTKPAVDSELHSFFVDFESRFDSYDNDDKDHKSAPTVSSGPDSTAVLEPESQEEPKPLENCPISIEPAIIPVKYKASKTYDLIYLIDFLLKDEKPEHFPVREETIPSSYVDLETGLNIDEDYLNRFKQLIFKAYLKDHAKRHPVQEHKVTEQKNKTIKKHYQINGKKYNAGLRKRKTIQPKSPVARLSKHPSKVNDAAATLSMNQLWVSYMQFRGIINPQDVSALMKDKQKWGLQSNPAILLADINREELWTRLLGGIIFPLTLYFSGTFFSAFMPVHLIGEKSLWYSWVKLIRSTFKFIAVTVDGKPFRVFRSPGFCDVVFNATLEPTAIREAYALFSPSVQDIFRLCFQRHLTASATDLGDKLGINHSSELVAWDNFSSDGRGVGYHFEFLFVLSVFTLFTYPFLPRRISDGVACISFLAFNFMFIMLFATFNRSFISTACVEGCDYLKIDAQFRQTHSHYSSLIAGVETPALSDNIEPIVWDMLSNFLPGLMVFVVGEQFVTRLYQYKRKKAKTTPLSLLFDQVKSRGNQVANDAQGEKPKLQHYCVIL